MNGNPVSLDKRTGDILRAIVADPTATLEQKNRASKILGVPPVTPQGVLGTIPEKQTPTPNRAWEIPTAGQAEVAGGMAAGLTPWGRTPYVSAIPAGVMGGGAALATDLLRGEFRSPKETAMSFARPALGELVTPPAFKAVGWGARKIGIAGRMIGKAGSQMVEALGEKYGVPLSASDITQTKPAAAIENFPNYFTFGSGFVQRFRKAQLEKYGEAVVQQAQRHYQGLADRTTSGLLAKGGIKEAAKVFRQQSADATEEIDRIAGDELVDVSNLKAVAKSILEKSSRRPLAAPRGTGKMAELGKPESTPTAPTVITPFGSVIDDLQDLVASEVNEIPFRDVKEIRSQLGELAFRGKKQFIGRIREGQLGAMYNAVDQDLEGWLASDAGLPIAPLERARREAYAKGKQLFNESVVSQLRKLHPDKLQQLPDMVFKADAPQNVLNFRKVVPQDVYDHTLASWYQGVIQDATKIEGGIMVFLPSKFVKKIEPYVEEGTLDIMFPPTVAQDIKDLVKLGSVLRTAERIAGNPSGTGQAFLGARQMFDVVRLIGTSMAAMGGRAAVGGIPGLAAGVGLPPVVGFLTTRKMGQKFMTHGFREGPVKRQIGRLGAQLGSQGALDEKQTPE